MAGRVEVHRAPHPHRGLQLHSELRPADEDVPPGRHQPGLRPHRRVQGPQPRGGGAQAHAAQLLHPRHDPAAHVGGHVHHRVLLYREHLLHPRHRAVLRHRRPQPGPGHRAGGDGAAVHPVRCGDLYHGYLLRPGGPAHLHARREQIERGGVYAD